MRPTGARLLILAIALTAAAGNAMAEQWVVNRETAGAICHVQVTTAKPFGPRLSGPFPDRKSACQSAKDSYNNMDSQAGCSSYGGGTVDGCKSDGVKLP